jgi:hypothetical protein
MGYTHYWYYTSKPTDKDNMKEVKRELLILKKILPEFSESAGGYYTDSILIKNWEGKGLPEILDDEIAFNGDDSKGLSHESFVFKISEGKERAFNFCKTARKPYDFFVCLALLSMVKNLEGIEISTDGDEQDWQPAIDFYEQHIGKIKLMEIW